MTDNDNPIIEFPKWLWEKNSADGKSYLERLDLLRRLVEYLQEGKSDEDIARIYNSTEDRIHSLRTQWYLYRANECPNCGERAFNPEEPCPNRRCITNWPRPDLDDKRKRR